MINNTIIEIREGDIFSEIEGYKVIAFNEYFDTDIPNIISENSLNGKYIINDGVSKEKIDKIIDNDYHAKKRIKEENRERSLGKQKKYQLGTIIKNGDYLLLAFSKFDQDNRAFLEINDYIECLLRMWEELDICYSGNMIVLPLLGSGITRFKGCESITDQELIETILWTFKYGKVNFPYPAKVRILLTKDSLNQINLFKVKEKFHC